MSDLTDLNVFKGELNSTLFPNAPAGLEIHSGFRDEHAITADEIRIEVQRLISDKGATQVTVVRQFFRPGCMKMTSLIAGWTQPRRCPCGARRAVFEIDS
jgi:hypothetical protein